MNIVAKSLVASAVALSLSGVALAEESGAFAGVELGASTGKAKFEISDIVDGTASINSKNTTSLVYGIKGGYKHFIDNDFGVRGYIYLGQQNASYKFGDVDLKMDIDALKYGVGADALYNFANDLGVFAGVSLGGGSYKLKSDGAKTTKSGFDVAINLGARMSIEKEHGVELGLSIPVVNPKLEEKDADGKATVTPKTAAALKLSYVFSF